MKSVQKQLQPVLKPLKYTWGEILDTVWLGATLGAIWGSAIMLFAGIIFF